MSRRYPDLEKQKQIAEAYKSGVGYNRISKEFQTTAKTIRKILVDFGIKPRGNQKEDHSRWNGGIIKRTNKKGRQERFIYVEEIDPFFCMTSKNQPYVREQRLVMARHIGRPLTRKETVHHIDGDTLNNAIENLQLRSSNHGPGQKRVCGDCGSLNIISLPLEDECLKSS